MSSATPTRRPWWRRPVARWIAALVAARVAFVVAFRGHRPALLNAVRRFNRRVLNPQMLRVAGGAHWYAARLEHRGRRSGRTYLTPVVARPVPGGFAVPLPYGTGVDWLRNLQASGRGTLLVKGRRYIVTQPRVVPTVAIAGDIGAPYRWMSHLYAIRCWLVVAVEPVNGDPRPAPRQADPAVTP